MIIANCLEIPALMSDKRFNINPHHSADGFVGLPLIINNEQRKKLRLSRNLKCSS